MLACALASAPFSMIEQNGHAVTTVAAPVSRSCWNRTSLIREPGSSSLSAKSRPPPAPAVAREITRVVIRHRLRTGDVGPNVASELLDEDRRVHDLDPVPEAAIVVANRLHAVRARRQDFLRPRGLQ